MSANPNDSSPGFYHKTGETASFIDAAGAYCSEGASEVTIDPAGGTSDPGASPPTLAAGVCIPDAPGISLAAEIFDSAGAYVGAGASAMATDLAGAYGLEAGAPVAAAADPAAGEVALSEADIAERFGAYSPAGAGARTIGPAAAHRSSGASLPPLAAAGASVPGVGAAPTPAEFADPDGASAPTIEGSAWDGRRFRAPATTADTFLSRPISAAAEIVGSAAALSASTSTAGLTAAASPDLTASPDTLDPNGAPAGYYYQAGANGLHRRSCRHL